MSIVEQFFLVRTKHPQEVRQHKYRAPLRPKQKRLRRWAVTPLHRLTDFDEVPVEADTPIVEGST